MRNYVAFVKEKQEGQQLKTEEIITIERIN